MAHYFEFVEKDATITRGQEADSTGSAKNMGADEILEIGKEFLQDSNTIKSISRTLIKFNLSEISQSIIDGDIPASASYYLNMYDAGSGELMENQTLWIYAVSQSWMEGAGYKSDNPQTEDGVSWKYRDSGSTQWTSTVSSSNWGGTTHSLSPAYQSFNKDEKVDMRADVSSIVHGWLSGSVANEGFLIQRTADDETSTTRFGISKFFSSDTHTVFPPKLEIVWEDDTWETGSLSGLNAQELERLKIRVENFRGNYKVGAVAKLRVRGRELYPAKNFTTTSSYLDTKYLPSGSSFYSIVDANTNDVIIPYGSGSKLSCDSTGNYFNLRTQGLFPERFYKINFQIISGSGINRNIDYFDDDRVFKVER